MQELQGKFAEVRKLLREVSETGKVGQAIARAVKTSMSDLLSIEPFITSGLVAQLSDEAEAAITAAITGLGHLRKGVEPFTEDSEEPQE